MHVSSIKHKGEQIKNLQLAHFIVTSNLSFNMYHEISTFEKEFHKGDHDNRFLTIKSGLEMTIYLSNSLFQDNVVDPVNHHRRL